MRAVFGGAPENLAEPERNMVRMIVGHGCEHRAEDLVVEHVPAVEHLREPVERLGPPSPLIDGRNRIVGGHLLPFRLGRAVLSRA